MISRDPRIDVLFEGKGKPENVSSKINRKQDDKTNIDSSTLPAESNDLNAVNSIVHLLFYTCIRTLLFV